MKLSPELATKYAQYRERFLGGTLGLYDGFPRRPDRPDPCGGDAGRRYKKDKYAPFMIIAGDPSAAEGSFLHVDRFVVGADVAPAEMEQTSILEVHSGDNTLYASFALVCFVAEYAITQVRQPLKIAVGIARSFQRLASQQRGFQETGNSPFGFMLRHDLRDTADLDENFCNFRSGTGSAAFQLAPSFDQFAGVLCNCWFAKSIILQTAADPLNDDLRVALTSIIDERVARILDFVAFKTNYTIRWEAGGSIRQTEDDRGPYCHAAAFPFARIASNMKFGDPSHYREFLGEVALDTITDLLIVFIREVAKAVTDQVVPFLREQFIPFYRGTITGEVFEAITKFLEFGAKVLELFDDHVLVPVKQHIIDPIITAFQNWTGHPVTGPISDMLSQEFFNIFVAGVLLDTSDKPLFQDSRPGTLIERHIRLDGSGSLADHHPGGDSGTLYQTT